MSFFLPQMVKLQACIKYCEEDYSAAKVTSSHNIISVNTHKKMLILFNMVVVWIIIICSKTRTFLKLLLCNCVCVCTHVYARVHVFMCVNLCVRLQSLLEQLPRDDPDYVYNMACLLYQDGKHEEACKKFMSAMQVLGYVPGNYLKIHSWKLKNTVDFKWWKV